MVTTILVILIILWILGFIPVSGIYIPNAVLFYINNHPITIGNIILFILLFWLIGVLPSPFREIATVILVLWVLTIVGIFAIAGLSNLLFITIIIGLIAYLLGGFGHRS